MDLSWRRLAVSLVTVCFAPLIVVLVALPLLWSVHEWNVPGWVVALVGCLCCGALLYSAWRLAQAVVERRFRFKLRTMLWAVAAAAVLLGLFGRWWFDLIGQRRNFSRIESFGARVYGNRLESNGTLDRWIGYDPFETEHDLTFTADRAVAEALDRPEVFPSLTQLSFEKGITSQAFTHPERFNDFPNVKYTAFYDAAIDDSVLQAIEQWKNLQVVFFNSCSGVTDAGVAELVKLPKLESLSFIGDRAAMQLNDAALIEIGKLKSLRELSLNDLPRLTDAGFQHLHGLTNLQELSIRGTGLTADGLEQLYEALPDCRITADVEIDGPQNIHRIEIRRIDGSQTPVRTITDRAQIASILQCIQPITDSKRLDQRLKPYPGTYEITFWGRARRLYQNRLSADTLQQNSQAAWDRWRISAGQAAELKQLLGLSGD